MQDIVIIPITKRIKVVSAAASMAKVR